MMKMRLMKITISMMTMTYTIDKDEIINDEDGINDEDFNDDNVSNDDNVQNFQKCQ